MEGLDMEGLKVCKFGGSSVANSSQIKKVAEIIRSDTRRKIIVVSAPKGITDILIACAERFQKTRDHPVKEFDRIKKIYEEIGEGLGVKKHAESVLEELKARINTKIPDKNEYEDFIKSWGEYSSARIISGYLNTIGIRSEFLDPCDTGMLVSGEFGNAKVLDESYIMLRKNLKNISGVILFPGFFGVTKNKRIATFSRGGSDLTGSILAAAAGAEMYENWTDQDGIRNADPNIVESPEQIKAITYKEIRELAYMGFNVFHAEAMIPAMKNSIAINIRNTNNPDNEGTYIMHHREPDSQPIIGIAARKNFAVFNIEKVLMDAEVGFGRRLLEIFEEKGISYEHSPSGIDSISVILDQTQLTEETAAGIIERIRRTLRPQSISVEFGKSLIRSEEHTSELQSH